jgi:hypothetical protein
MEKKITNNTKNTFRIHNESIGGFALTVNQVGATDNVPITDPGFDPEKITIDAVIYRANGYKLNLLPNQPLYVHALQSAFKKSNFQQVYKAHSGYDALVLLAAGASNKENSVHPYYIDFEGNITVRGDEYIEVNINVNSDSAHSTVSTADSSIIFKTIPAVSNPLGDVYTEIYPIVTTEPNPVFDLGDNVTEIAFINLDKTNHLAASRVVTNVRLDSDRTKLDLSYDELLNMRQQQFELHTSANERDQSFMIVDGVELDNVKVQLKLNLSNVTAGKNFLCVRKYVVTPELAARFSQRNQKHSMQFAKKTFLV